MTQSIHDLHPSLQHAWPAQVAAALPQIRTSGEASEFFGDPRFWEFARVVGQRLSWEDADAEDLPPRIVDETRFLVGYIAAPNRNARRAIFGSKKNVPLTNSPFEQALDILRLLGSFTEQHAVIRHGKNKHDLNRTMASIHMRHATTFLQKTQPWALDATRDREGLAPWLPEFARFPQRQHRWSNEFISVVPVGEQDEYNFFDGQNIGVWNQALHVVGSVDELRDAKFLPRTVPVIDRRNMPLTGDDAQRGRNELIRICYENDIQVVELVDETQMEYVMRRSTDATALPGLTPYLLDTYQSLAPTTFGLCTAVNSNFPKMTNTKEGETLFRTMHAFVTSGDFVDATRGMHSTDRMKYGMESLRAAAELTIASGRQFGIQPASSAGLERGL